MYKKQMTSLITASILFCVGLFTLISCQPTPYFEETPVEVTFVPTAVATKANALADAPKATETMAATSTPDNPATPTTKMLPTAPPEATEPAPNAAIPESEASKDSEPIMIYERTGGFAGLTEQWEIYADGRIANNNERAWQANPADVTELQADIIALDFFALEASYIPKTACCDRFSYTLTLTYGTQSHTTTTIEQTESAPDNLWAALDLVQTFLTETTAN